MGGNFVSYHWLLIKHVGRRISDKWRTEVFSSVGVGAIIFCISWVVGDAGALLAFKIALLANAIWLGIFAIIHIVRAPYLFHSKPELVVQARSAPLKVGLIGVLSLLAILVGLGAGIVLLYPHLQPKIYLSVSADPGARESQIRQLKTEVQVYKTTACPQVATSRGTAVLPPSTPQSPQPCLIAQRQFPGQMFIARHDPQVRNVGLIVNAFTYLLPELPGSLGGVSPGCHLKITAPKDNDETALTLFEMASLTRCRVDYRASNDLEPDIEAEALRDADMNTVTVHAPKGDARYDNFANRLSLLLHVKRKYDAVREGTSDQVVWLQIGPGFPWHVENTYVTTFGAR